MPREGSSARLVRNTLASGATSVLGLGLSLVLLPFLIHQLGTEAYGVWALAISLSFIGGYASLTDLGVEASAARYVAEGRSTDDDEAVNRTLSTALAFFGGMALLITPPLVLLAGALTGLFNIDADLQNDAQLCFMLVACHLFFELPARVFFAALEGVQRFTVYQAIEATRAILQAALFVTVVLAGWGIVGLGAALAATSLLVLIVGAIASRRAIPSMRLSPSRVSRVELRRLIRFGGALFILRFAGLLYRQMDRVIIGIALGVRQVTTYEVANRIQGGALMVQSISTSAVLPAAAYARAQPQILRDMYVRGTRYSSAISLPVVIAALIFAEPLITDWLGDSLRDAVSPTRIFLCVLLLMIFNNVGTTMLVALGRRLKAYIVAVVANVLINLVVSIALVHPLGINGVLIGSLIGNGLLAPYLVHLCLREFGVSVGEWARGIIWPMVPGLAVQAVTAAPLLWLADESDSLLATAALICLSILLALGAFLLVGVSRNERGVISTTLRSALGLPLRPATAQPE